MRTSAKKEERYREMRERIESGADGRVRKPMDRALEIQIGEPVFTLAEVAAMLRIGVETARRRLRNWPGVLRFVPPGKAALIRIPQTAVEAHQREATALPPLE